MKLRKIVSTLLSVPKTLYVNFRYLPFRQAIKIPIWCHWNSSFTGNGKIILDKAQTTIIRLGSSSHKFPSQKFALCVTGVLRFKGAASIGTGCKMLVEGSLTIGDKFACSGGGIIDCKSDSTFGDSVLVGHQCTFIDCDGHSILRDGVVINETAGYHIGNHVWFGRECLVLKGTRVCDNVIFGARSTISGNYKVENAVYVGAPAKTIKDGVIWMK